MEKISYNDIVKLGACENGLAWFKSKFGIDGEATFDELLECQNHKWISWVISFVPAYQTSENLEKYLKMNKTDYRDFRWLIAEVPKYQTSANLEKYLKMNNDKYLDFRWLIKNIPNYQTEENYEILNKMQEVQKWKQNINI